jgi:hypothetical protein
MSLDSLNKRAAGSSLLICLWPWRGNRAVDGYQVWVDSRSGADLAVLQRARPSREAAGSERQNK